MSRHTKHKATVLYKGKTSKRKCWCIKAQDHDEVLDTPPKKEECFYGESCPCHCKPSGSTDQEILDMTFNKKELKDIKKAIKPASPDNEILQILMRYENPIPVGMDTSKGSIELDHNETVRHLEEYIRNLLSSERQSLYSLILKGMPEKYDSDPYGVMDDRELKRIQEAKIRNKTLDDVTKVLSEIFGKEENGTKSK